MKPLAWVGLILVILGIASLFVPIPRREHQGIKAGDVSLGVEVQREEKVHPGISAALILSGAGLMVVSRRRA
jgi:hypothetical protein